MIIRKEEYTFLVTPISIYRDVRFLFFKKIVIQETSDVFSTILDLYLKSFTYKFIIAKLSAFVNFITYFFRKLKFDFHFYKHC